MEEHGRRPGGNADTVLHRPSSSRQEAVTGLLLSPSFCERWQRTHSPQLLNFLDLSASQKWQKKMDKKEERGMVLLCVVTFL